MNENLLPLSIIAGTVVFVTAALLCYFRNTTTDFLTTQNTNKNSMKHLLITNWKTTVIGIAVAVLAYLSSTHTITTEQATLAGGIMAALGFGVAKDGNVSGNGSGQ